MAPQFGFAALSMGTDCSHEKLKEKEGQMRDPQSIPAPTTTSDIPSVSGSNGDRCNHSKVATKKWRIRWTLSLDADLVKCSDSVQIYLGAGQRKELVRLWQELHSDLPGSETALRQQLSRTYIARALTA